MTDATKRTPAHTAGPWEMKRAHTGGFNVYSPTTTDYIGSALDGADARLIAAAPELLEYGEAVASACDAFMDDPYNVDAHQRLEMSLEDLRTIINKAKGNENA